MILRFSHLEISQSALCSEEHLRVVVDTERWLAMRTDVCLETLLNHLSRRDGRVEDLVRWVVVKSISFLSEEWDEDKDSQLSGRAVDSLTDSRTSCRVKRLSLYGGVS